MAGAIASPAATERPPPSRPGRDCAEGGGACSGARADGVTKAPAAARSGFWELGRLPRQPAERRIPANKVYEFG
ncbi:hypothetical protein Celaphus_00012850 [Cervus elaphus hippelaphus]|uniref:Uncharacterized protein n=1 Tax=Cervus elaphus hippelaphus TaxID=46360 RepID=A0A212CIQ1_CEREH|nr:hypothetical protein Celaphus_00012850 [Cervus elaphus hippelaphus]